MGVSISTMHALFGIRTDAMIGHSRSVFNLANRCLMEVLEQGSNYSHLLASTSCPDSVSPSLGQCLNQQYNEILGSAHTIDIVQGCAGGVSAMILASQLSEMNQSNVLVVCADAAQKATSASDAYYEIFKNGVFGCCFSHTKEAKGLLHFKSVQYKDLTEVVRVRIGHDADAVIMNNLEDMLTDPRKHLGLRLDNRLAIKLMQKAEQFYLEFIAETGHPDILILHQVNGVIINHLQQVFQKYPIRFVNMAAESGNCGCATTGIVLNAIKEEIVNKKIMICSFGTGGVIVAGLWQC